MVSEPFHNRNILARLLHFSSMHPTEECVAARENHGGLVIGQPCRRDCLIARVQRVEAAHYACKIASKRNET